jgi:3-oxoacyl-[acyl-carrier protein] reductase
VTKRTRLALVTGCTGALCAVSAELLDADGACAEAVAPGLIAAGMFLGTPMEYQDEGIARTPMKSAGTAEEVTHAISFFASPEASFVTAQTLFACGGLSNGF